MYWNKEETINFKVKVFIMHLFSYKNESNSSASNLRPASYLLRLLSYCVQTWPSPVE